MCFFYSPDIGRLTKSTLLNTLSSISNMMCFANNPVFLIVLTTKCMNNLTNYGLVLDWNCNLSKRSIGTFGLSSQFDEHQFRQINQSNFVLMKLLELHLINQSLTCWRKSPPPNTFLKSLNTIAGLFFRYRMIWNGVPVHLFFPLTWAADSSKR